MVEVAKLRSRGRPKAEERIRGRLSFINGSRNSTDVTYVVAEILTAFPLYGKFSSGVNQVRGPILDRNGVYHYRRRIPDDVRRALRELDASSAEGVPRRDKREEKKRLGRDKVKAEAAWSEHDRTVELIKYCC